MSELDSVTVQEGFCFEPGGWLAVRRPRPDLASQSAESLLGSAVEHFCAPLRFARTPDGVALFGEDYLHDAAGGVEGARARLRRWLACASTPANMPDDEWVETLLAQHAPGWSHRDEGWLAPAGTDLPTQLLVRTVAGGLRVETQLAALADTDQTCRAALAEFLVRSQAALRFSRIELGPDGAYAVSRVETESLDADFVHSLNSIRAAAQGLVQEAQALLAPDLARAYLEIASADPPGL